MRSAVEAYQQALRPFTKEAQVPPLFQMLEYVLPQERL
jgi:hypothetical protein